MLVSRHLVSSDLCGQGEMQYCHFFLLFDGRSSGKISLCLSMNEDTRLHERVRVPRLQFSVR